MSSLHEKTTRFEFRKMVIQLGYDTETTYTYKCIINACKHVTPATT